MESKQSRSVYLPKKTVQNNDSSSPEGSKHAHGSEKRTYKKNKYKAKRTENDGKTQNGQKQPNETEIQTIKTNNIEEQSPLQKVAPKISPLTNSLGEEDYCPICVEPIEFSTIGKCSHIGICALCSLRRRMLYKISDCPICRQPSEWVILIQKFKKPFEEYDVSSLSKEEELKLYFENEEAEAHYNKLKRLWQLFCPYCEKETFKNLNLLKNHLKEEHKLLFCNLCLNDRKVFLQEQKLYLFKDLKMHERQGDKDTLVKHEFCQFCSKYLYDNDKLYEHLRDTHETCFICERNGIHYQYYKNYTDLEKHYHEAHYVCEDPECLQNKLGVFATDRELHLHEVEKHLSSKSGSRSQKKQVAALKVDFTVRSGTSSLLANQSKEDEVEDKELDVTAEEQFPSLDGQVYAGVSLQPKITWRKTETRLSEAFPALPSQSRLSEMDSRLRDLYPSLSTTAPKGFNVSWGKPSPPPKTTSENFPALAQEPLGKGGDFPSLPTSVPNKKLSTKPLVSVWGSDKKNDSRDERILPSGSVIFHSGGSHRVKRNNKRF